MSGARCKAALAITAFIVGWLASPVKTWDEDQPTFEQTVIEKMIFREGLTICPMLCALRSNF